MTTQTQSNQPTTSTPDSWESRLLAAATFMGLSTEEVEVGLKNLGVEKEPAGMEMLSDEEVTPFGDIRKVFGDDKNIPLAKVRMATKYLRGPKDSNKTDSLDPEMVELKKKYGIKINIENIDPAELLGYYHPEQPNHPVSTALKKKFGNKPIIVFKPDSKKVDIEETSNYISDLEQGYPEQETVEVDGVLVRIYSVGQVPNEMVDEDPLFPGQPLKRGRSIVNRINWATVPEEARKFCRIIVEMDEIDTGDKFAIRELLKLASRDISELRKIYPDVDLEYRERKQKDELPKLHLSLQEANGNIGKQDPFGVKNRSY